MESHTPASTEGKQLDDVSGEEAKSILMQLGYFDPEICFTSFRFNAVEFQQVQKSLALTNLTPEQLISALCEQDVIDHEAEENSL